MQALLDNDLVYKVARLDLLPELDALLVAWGSRVPYGRLGTARHVLRTFRQPPPTDRWPVSGQQAALDAFLLNRCVSLRASDAILMARLADVRGIDSGEVQLFARAMELTDAIIVTGDKNAMRALAQNAQLTDITTALAGKLVSFEMVLACISRRCGAGRIRAANATYPGVDGALASACSRSSDDTVLRRNLERYVAMLRAETGYLLRTI